MITETRAPAHEPERVFVGTGELSVCRGRDATIVARGIGSCVAVCVWDPVVTAGGLLHFLLPESRINPERAAGQPATFADLGIPLLFERLRAVGVDTTRATVKLVGGAEIAPTAAASAFNIGRRNALAARQMLWRTGAMVAVEELGGTAERTVAMNVVTGAITISSGHTPRKR
jgi:chemotaxis protein CheD